MSDKIRAAAQALLDAVDGKYIDECSGEIDALRAALAEPAQVAPAADAVPVPVVAQVSAAVESRNGVAVPNLFWFVASALLEPGDPLIRQRDHLAAMEALRADLDHAHAAANANSRDAMRHLDAARQELTKAKALSVTGILLAIVPGKDGMGEEVYAQSVTEVENLLADLGEKAEERDSLRQEVERLREIARESAEAATRHQGEVLRLRADAALYRWIEEHALCIDQTADGDNFVQVWWEATIGRPVARATLRKAVEAAMAARATKLAGEA